MLIVGVIGCNKTSDTEESGLQQLSLNCVVHSFMEGVSITSNDNCIYIIKGIVLDKIEHGLKIRLVEDLKGNFPENRNTFIVWGGGTPFNTFLNRQDNYVELYENQDVLIMLLTPSRDLPVGMNPSGYAWLEKPEDFTTVPCINSILMLSDCCVTGHMLPYEEKEDRWWDEMSREELSAYTESLSLKEQLTLHMDKMSYDDFQKKLNELLIK